MGGPRARGASELASPLAGRAADTGGARRRAGHVAPRAGSPPPRAEARCGDGRGHRSAAGLLRDPRQARSLLAAGPGLEQALLLARHVLAGNRSARTARRAGLPRTVHDVSRRGDAHLADRLPGRLRALRHRAQRHAAARIRGSDDPARRPHRTGAAGRATCRAAIPSCARGGGGRPGHDPRHRV